MKDFIDTHRATHGVEPICKVLQIAPSGYRRHAARQRDPQRRCARAQRDDVLMPQIEQVWQANMRVYGADKVWRQLARQGTSVARCTVERLMRRQGLRGVMRGKVVRTTISDNKAVCPLDKVNRQFRAERPNQLWVSDFTYVSTWQGWLYVAFVIDVFARRIVGWRVSSSMRTDFVLDALEQALYARQPERHSSLVHHSDRGSQGEFNWSLQHPSSGECCDGFQEARPLRARHSSLPRVGRTAERCASRDHDAVLALDCSRGCQRAGWRRSGRIRGGRGSVVQARWRHAYLEPLPAVGPLPVVCRA